jgi:hypothetical protein
MLDTVHSLWVGDELGPLQRLAISSFLRHGHEFHLFCYEPVAGVPDGVVVRDGKDILPANAIFRYARGGGKGSVSAFSNLFRYKLLLDRGGWWVDTDVVCLKPFDFVDTVVLASELTRERKHLAASVIKLPPGHEIARRCYDAAAASDRESLRWGEIGPKLLDRVVTELGAWEHVRDTAVFSPVPWWEWETLLGDDTAYIKEETMAVHLWHELWRRAGISKDWKFRGRFFQSLETAESSVTFGTESA